MTTRHSSPPSIAIVVLTVLLGIVYPLVITGVARSPSRATPTAQQINVDGKLVGSKLIGQDFAASVDKNGKPKDKDGNPVTAPDPRYFQPRPSATDRYNAAATHVLQPRPERQGRPSSDRRRTSTAYLAARAAATTRA